MNEAHFHLVVNHLPLILPFAALIVLAIGMVLKAELVKRSAYSLLLVSTLFAVGSMVSGEGAEELVEHLPGVSHDHVETHEDAAKLFALVHYFLGLVSLVAIWASFKKKNFAGILNLLVLGLTVVVLYFGQAVGNTGGEIMHQEIRKDFKPDSDATEHED